MSALTLADAQAVGASPGVGAELVLFSEAASDLTTPAYSIAAAATRAGLHQQTIRAWEREGLVSPSRTRGRTRRYSRLDLAQLAEIRRLSEDGVSIEGIRRILALQREVAQLRAELAACQR